jgi:hypothetical protein
MLALGSNYRLLAKKDAKEKGSVYFKLLSQHFAAPVKTNIKFKVHKRPHKLLISYMRATYADDL